MPNLLAQHTGNHPSIANKKIIINGYNWIALNHITGNLSALFDGDTLSAANFTTPSFNKLNTFIYPIVDNENITISQIKMYDAEGDYTSHPAVIFAVDNKGIKTKIATFKGSAYKHWVGPNNMDSSNQFGVLHTVHNIAYIIIECLQNNLPTEIEFYGTQIAKKNTTQKHTFITQYYPLHNYLGINGFEWDFVQPTINSKKIDTLKYAAIQKFTAFRHYLDWERLEDKQGKYTYSPCHYGGWDYDMMYKQCKKDSITILACIKNIPSWMLKSYPMPEQQIDNAPHFYNATADVPSAYKAIAALAFQFTARYGSNKKINPQLILVDTLPRWKNDVTNSVQQGLDVVGFIECGNELDKWWRGKNGYMNCFEYAALLSAFYDGHKNTMGVGIGVKNADSNMQVVIGGLANMDINYLQGMVEWCRINRGYLPNGRVNICWDIINYHFYANNTLQGIAPENSDFFMVASKAIKFAKMLQPTMPVWITETGYDANYGSTQNAPAINNKPPAAVQADWLLRTQLVAARAGIAKLFFYQLKDFNASLPVKYASMGLVDSTCKSRPALNFLQQVNKVFGHFYFKQTIQNKPNIDAYTDGKNTMYVAWMPTQNNSSVTYNINIKKANKVLLFYPNLNAPTFKIVEQLVIKNTVNITVTETPIFIVPVLSK